VDMAQLILLKELSIRLSRQYNYIKIRTENRMKIEKPVYVTQPFLPPIQEFVEYLDIIWENKWITNGGQFHKEFEKALCNYLGVEYISLFANGTLALMIGLQSLRITGEVITTPYSFVATTHALHWNRIQPVFCDIEPTSMGIDPNRIESLITPSTTAIMPVHIYGNPCNVDEIQKIADVYGLKVIYDAAHAFGVKQNNKSILNNGDLSILSFHATKVLTTFEGGAIVCHDPEMKNRIDHLKNFGFSDEVTVIGNGINGKMNEVQAAMGLLQLKHIDTVISRRMEIARLYRDGLKEIGGIRYIDDIEDVQHNYSYFPIFIDEHEYGKSRDKVHEEFRKYNIYSRRYFYPLISHFPAYRGLMSANRNNLPIAEKISKQVLCLPFFPDLNNTDVFRILDILKRNNG
jgi:dTDP-4-amino-4,6-dideoxygalactose transaminase